jgi:hypothetical protein
MFTPTDAGVTIGIGTTFLSPGHTAAGTTFALNNPMVAGQNMDRTYSAQLTGNASGVPEPGTFTLFTSGAGLLLAGLLRFRRTPRA